MKVEKMKYCPPVRATLANNPLHRIAARVRFGENLKGLGWGGKR